ncbi:hypothetical protein IJT17_02115 [bacterium]|nr:hypothetical protein [bacterium]
MSKKSLRNVGKERRNKVTEAEKSLEKMRFYWIFNVVWLAFGAFLIAVGLNSSDAQVATAAAVKVGGFIIILAIGMAIYGAKRQYSLSKQVAAIKKKADKHNTDKAKAEKAEK